MESVQYGWESIEMISTQLIKNIDVRRKKELLFTVQAIFMITGFSQLLLSDSYYVPYQIIVVLGFLCFSGNIKNVLQEDSDNSKKLIKWLKTIFALFFACMITLANYTLWNLKSFNGLFSFVTIFFGGFFAFENIFLWIAGNIQKIIWKERVTCNPMFVFFSTFGAISCINLLVLFLCMYPGNLTPDSISQMSQLIFNSYSNHHPFYHTLIIKLFVSIGFRIFHEINAAVAFYSVCSILFMAASFSFAIATVAELHVPKWIIVLLQLFFILMPYHIMYSMTMWKDVFFGAVVLLYILFFFRCMRQISPKKFNYVGLIVSSFGVCLLRSNGFFAFVFVTLFFLFLWKFRKKKILFIMFGVLVCSFVLKHPVLRAIGVAQPDLIESLSIPAQQIARDVVDNNDLTDKQRELLSQVVSIDRIPDSYDPSVSDPIKNLVRERGNQEYIRSHGLDFIRLYFSIGLKHPLTYLRGWIDQTKGYWNAGYSYWRWYDGVQENDLGINRKINSENAHSLITWYLAQFSEQPALWIFLCIGFFDWMMLIALFIAIVRKDKIGVMLTIPNIMVVFSLLVATPVYSEFRYDYAVFCTLPIVLALVLRPIPSVYGKEKD